MTRGRCFKKLDLPTSLGNQRPLKVTNLLLKLQEVTIAEKKLDSTTKFWWFEHCTVKMLWEHEFWGKKKVHSKSSTLRRLIYSQNWSTKIVQAKPLKNVTFLFEFLESWQQKKSVSHSNFAIEVPGGGPNKKIHYWSTCFPTNHSQTFLWFLFEDYIFFSFEPIIKIQKGNLRCFVTEWMYNTSQKESRHFENRSQETDKTTNIHLKKEKQKGAKKRKQDFTGCLQQSNRWVGETMNFCVLTFCQCQNLPYHQFFALDLKKNNILDGFKKRAFQKFSLLKTNWWKTKKKADQKKRYFLGSSAQSFYDT